jgi:serine/threonine protein kinase
VPLNDSFRPRQTRPNITKLSAIPSAEDLAFAQTKARPGNPIAMSWPFGNEKRVLFIIPSMGQETGWILRTEEEFDAPMLWRYATNDAEIIHTMLVGELQVEGTSIPEELRPTRELELNTLKVPAHPPQIDLTPPSADDFLPGTVFEERYEIISLIGSGGMGAVYKARQISVDRFVALKVLHPDLVTDPISKKRFEHEAKAASTLMHPNLIVVHDFGFSKKGQPFIVMDYLEGPTLHDLIEATGPLDLNRLIRVFIQCCRALSHAHRKNVIHRDVKPCNIVLSLGDSSDPEFVKVLDFGIAKVLAKDSGKSDQNLTNTGNIVGSPFFMSPEQCCGLAVDARSDIYSLGCVLYAAATACAPFIGEDHLRTMYKHLYEVAPSFAVMRPDLTIPAELERIVFKAIEKDPNARYQSADELEDALERLKMALKKAGQIVATGDIPPAEPAKLAADLLLRTKIVTIEQMQEASKIQAGLGGEITSILVAQGKLDYTLADAANKCRALILEGNLSYDHGLQMLEYCEKTHMPFEQAVKELGWDWIELPTT